MDSDTILSGISPVADTSGLLAIDGSSIADLIASARSKYLGVPSELPALYKSMRFEVGPRKVHLCAMIGQPNTELICGILIEKAGLSEHAAEIYGVYRRFLDDADAGTEGKAEYDFGAQEFLVSA